MDLANQIVRWFRENGRKFPWRETEEPYKILIGELMLQKTSASQVLSVYKELLKKYPGPEELSKASAKKIEKMIYPLGLQNTRAKRLKDLAKKLVDDFGGKVPDKEEELKGLPGVGDYISKSVMCLAFGQRRAMIDANAGRVLGRFYEGEENYSMNENIRERAEALLPDKNFREFNLGILDFGALVCRPKNPLCKECPLSRGCKRFEEQGNH